MIEKIIEDNLEDFEKRGAEEIKRLRLLDKNVQNWIEEYKKIDAELAENELPLNAPFRIEINSRVNFLRSLYDEK